MNTTELIINSSVELKAVSLSHITKEQKVKKKSIKSFKNLINKELKNLKSLDSIPWAFSVHTSSQGVEMPVLTRGEDSTNIFMNKLGHYGIKLDVMEQYYADQILKICQQIKIFNISLKEIL